MDTVKRRNFIAKALHLPPQLFTKKQPRDHPHHHQQLQLLHPNSVVEGKNNDTLNIDVDGTGLNGETIRTVLQNNIERRRAKPKQEEAQEEATGEELATAKRLVHSQSSPAGQLPLCEFDSAAKERPANRQQRQEQRQSKNSSTEPKMQSSSSAEDADNQQTTTKKGMGGGGRGGKAVRFVSDHEDEARAEKQEEEEERADESDVEDNAEEEEKGGEREKELVAALRTEMERRKRTDQRGNGGNGGIGHGQTQQQQHKNSTSSAGISAEEEQSQRQQIERLREAHFELERAQKSVQFLQFQIQEKDVQFNELKERMDNLQNQLQRDMERKNAQLAEYERLLAAANTKIEQLLEQEHEKQQTIDGLHKKLSQAFEAASMGSRGMNGTMEQEEGGQNDSSEEGNQNGTQDDATDGSPNGMTEPEAIANLRTEIGKLEQKLQSATEEKDYYKKHFKGEQQPAAHNGHSVGPNHLTDDFGKELMLANKRKYQLEGRMKQLERELREVQQRATHLDESLKSTEKLLWLEKERTATLENEREQLNRELNELRKEADTMRRDLEAHRGEGNHPFFSEREHQEDLNKLRAECDQRYNELRDMKNKVEWRMGEVTQSYHDTKWRLGEIESTLAHRDWQLEQANNRIKELEGSLIASDPAKLSDELNKLKQELGKVCEEKGKLEWRVGEVTQWWNDAKWRVGELESESAHRSHLLDKAHHKIGELERKLENYACGFDLSKAYNDAKWRVGELEAEVGRIRYEKDQAYKEVNELKEQKGKMEWRLGEVTQWWNEAKWKINELEERMGRGGGGGVEIWSNSGLEKKLVDVEAANERLRSLVQDETFLVRKQPHADRKKWKTLTFENMRNASMRRVWFETDAGNAKQVFLIGSFLNWECALLCEPVPEKPKRVGIWVDMPLGRIEFSFLRDGQWQHGSEYSWTWTQHGTKNNVMFVE